MQQGKGSNLVEGVSTAVGDEGTSVLVGQQVALRHPPHHLIATSLPSAAASSPKHAIQSITIRGQVTPEMPANESVRRVREF